MAFLCPVRRRDKKKGKFYGKKDNNLQLRRMKMKNKRLKQQTCLKLIYKFLGDFNLFYAEMCFLLNFSHQCQFRA